MNKEANIDIQEFMNMIKDYDAATLQHCKRVSVLCGEMCDVMEYPMKEELVRAALVHDVGKILIPKNILHKRTRLDRLEGLIVNSHAHWGYEILSTSTLTEIERQFVLYHHGFTNFPIHSDEGYLQATVTKCVDNVILEGSLILQTCDIFDAMTSRRPYRRAQAKEAAYAALEEKHIPKDMIEHLQNIVNSVEYKEA